MKLKERKNTTTIAIAVLFVAAVAMVAYILLPAGKNGGFLPGQKGTGNGAPAVPEVVAATCTDTDASEGEAAIYSKGTVTAINSRGEKTVSTDECDQEDSRYLIEWTCQESPLGSKNFGAGRIPTKCPNGCKAGACVK